ncbi:glycosyltransferase [Opitutales bacterium]|nr:glycosyltransferase [Opitutales bacterium]
MPEAQIIKGLKPFFSIVIACFNDLIVLKRCIASVNEQNFTSYEVLISDGASNDGTTAFLSSGSVRNLGWCKSSTDTGIYDALNAALPAIQGKWVLVLGADDRLSDSNALARAHAAILKQKNDNHFFYSDLYISDISSVRLKRYPAFDEFCRRYAGAPFIHHQTALITSSAIREINGFDKAYRIHSDYDLMLKVLRYSSAVKLDDAYVVYDATGYSSRLRNITRSISEVWHIRRSHGFRPFTFRFAVIYSRVLIKSFLLSWRRDQS